MSPDSRLTHTKTALHILVAEDNAFNRAWLVELLQQAMLSFTKDVHITQATHGKEALALVSAHAYDLLIVDAYMPELNGLDLIKTVRENDSSDYTFNQNSNIIVFTAAENLADKYPYRHYIDAWLYKPLTQDQLHHCLQPWFQELAQKNDDNDTEYNKLPTNLWPLLAKDLDAQLIDLQAAYRIQDKEKLSEYLHRLKGVAAYTGYLDLRDTVRELQKKVKAESELQNYAYDFWQLIRRIQQVIRVLRQYD